MYAKKVVEQEMEDNAKKWKSEYKVWQLEKYRSVSSSGESLVTFMQNPIVNDMILQHSQIIVCALLAHGYGWDKIISSVSEKVRHVLDRTKNKLGTCPLDAKKKLEELTASILPSTGPLSKMEPSDTIQLGESSVCLPSTLVTPNFVRELYNDIKKLGNEKLENHDEFVDSSLYKTYSTTFHDFFNFVAKSMHPDMEIEQKMSAAIHNPTKIHIDNPVNIVQMAVFIGRRIDGSNSFSSHPTVTSGREVTDEMNTGNTTDFLRACPVENLATFVAMPQYTPHMGPVDSMYLKRNTRILTDWRATLKIHKETNLSKIAETVKDYHDDESTEDDVNYLKRKIIEFVQQYLNGVR